MKGGATGPLFEVHVKPQEVGDVYVSFGIFPMFYKWIFASSTSRSI